MSRPMEHPDDAPLADEPQPGAVPNDQPAAGEGEDVGAPAADHEDDDETGGDVNLQA